MQAGASGDCGTGRIGEGREAVLIFIFIAVVLVVSRCEGAQG